jgi:uncharacterized cupredoxin-like copper-binding protein
MSIPRNRTLLFAAVALVVSACGGGKTATADSSPAKDNTFSLREWSITPPNNTLKAGKVKVSAANVGNETHELVIVRAPDAASLPTKTDGSVDEDKIAESDKVGEITDLPPGKVTTKAFDIPAGDYVAFCNLVDQMGMGNGGMGNGGMGNGGTGGGGMSHVHYRLGMVTTFTVA